MELIKEVDDEGDAVTTSGPRYPKHFQLYYTLNRDFQERDLNKSEKEFLRNKLTELKQNRKGLEAFVLLIFEHYFVEHGEIPKEVPYGGKQTREGCSFDIESFPVKLRWILYKFTNVVK